MDQSTDYCLHCGVSQPKNDQICCICGGALEAQIEKDTPLVQPPQPGSLRRRRLMVGLVLGGVGLTGIGGCIRALKRAGLPGSLLAEPPKLPVDPHRIRNFPLGEELTDFTWLPDNRHLIGASNQTRFLIDTTSGQKVWEQGRSFSSSGNVQRKMLWSADKRYGAEFGDGGAVVWESQSGQIIWDAPPPGNRGNTAYSCALAPNGAFFALCMNANTDTDPKNTIQNWDIHQNRLLKDWPVQDTSANSQGQIRVSEVIDIAWSPDNTRLALICRGGSVQVWHALQGSLLWTYDTANGWEASLQWSPDGTSLAVQLNFHHTPMDPLLVLDAHTGKLRFQTSWVILDNNTGVRSTSLVWSRDGTNLAVVTYENPTYVVQVWNARTGQRLVTCQRVQGRPFSLSWSPDGRYLAAGMGRTGPSQDGHEGEDSTIQFWDAPSGKALFSYQAPRVPGQLTWSPSSHLLATCNPQDYGNTGGWHQGYLNFALQVFQVV